MAIIPVVKPENLSEKAEEILKQEYSKKTYMIYVYADVTDELSFSMEFNCLADAISFADFYCDTSSDPGDTIKVFDVSKPDELYFLKC